MSKRRRSSSKNSNHTFSNRIPPSVPRCVMKCPDGYVSDFTTADNLPDTTIRFFYVKNGANYTVLRQAADSPEKINMYSDIRISPQTRKLFSNLSTLRAAIDATETWLKHKLPDIR